MNKILFGDNAEILPMLPSEYAHLIYIDPPFNTGNSQVRGDNIYTDQYEAFEKFLMPRIYSAIKCLIKTGSIFVHLDYHEVHYIKVALDKMLGRHRFMNEIIWAYDYGGRSKNRWPTKHDTILWYAMNPNDYVFNFSEIDRIPYMAPSFVGEKKAKLGKTVTDVWWHTIVPTNGKEKTGYPTQKPRGILDRIIKVHTRPGDIVLDFFCGSGTTGASAAYNNRSFVLIDKNIQAVNIAARRLVKFSPELNFIPDYMS